ncbi:TPA: hypothetical protein I7730_16370 [Vibrio vulnificus]|uniref:Uncharacterized protein n=1 Tax=Vibrio vulnificus TaxID=672 RepID=A0A8H9TGS5_VIBVL|nr:hypothetical protein [Vibrio vulnificus]HAS8541360.1 hypothetical protein [Vibrio vulnificus]
MNLNTQLPLAFTVYELIKNGLTPAQALTEMKSVKAVIEKHVQSTGDYDQLSNEEQLVAQMMLSRALFSLPAEKRKPVLKWLIESKNDLDESWTNIKSVPSVLVSTTLCRAFHKFDDFVLQLVLLDGLSMDRYNTLLQDVKNHQFELMRSCMSVYSENGSGELDLIMFCSLLEDILVTTLTPLFETVVNSTRVRRRFIEDTNQLLDVLHNQVLEKLKGSLMLSSELISLSKINTIKEK